MSDHRHHIAYSETIPHPMRCQCGAKATGTRWEEETPMSTVTEIETTTAITVKLDVPVVIEHYAHKALEVHVVTRSVRQIPAEFCGDDGEFTVVDWIVFGYPLNADGRPSARYSTGVNVPVFDHESIPTFLKQQFTAAVNTHVLTKDT